ncbi:MAG: class I SAM-dependent DNA methyltransferase [Bryobacteraceae bacterium]
MSSIWIQTGAAFNRIAQQYDESWTRSTAGRLQRDAVWRYLDLLFQPCSRLLDLGCGTGEDPVHFMQAGMSVTAIDASEEMVSIARARGVEASVLGIEDLDRIQGRFDGAISNFGAFNCISQIDSTARALANLIRPGGYLAICVFGRRCIWEVAWYLLHGDPRRAFRRMRPPAISSSLGIPVHPHSIRELKRTFAPDFKLIDWRGIGLLVPPSYVTGTPDSVLRKFEKIDRNIAHRPILRAFADHLLAIFERR